MIITLIFGLNNSLGGAERRLIRVYNKICAENDDIKCDIVIRVCDLNTALALFMKVDCDVANINHIYVFQSRLRLDAFKWAIAENFKTGYFPAIGAVHSEKSP